MKKNAMKSPAHSNIVCYPLGTSQTRPKPDILLPPLLLFDSSRLLTLTTGISSIHISLSSSKTVKLESYKFVLGLSQPE